MDPLSEQQNSVWNIIVRISTLTVYLSIPWLLISYARTRFRPGLRNIPGPFIASISNLDRIWSCARGLQQNYHLQLHNRYGRFVRIGPSHVSFSDPELIPQIYSITSKFYKSDFYSMFDVVSPAGRMPTIFSVRNEAEHKAIQRPVAHAYSLSSLRELEPMNDECSAIFLRKLDGLVGQEINLGEWLHWYATDVIMSITFSNRLGFMEREEDVENIIRAVDGRRIYNAIIGQLPSLHPYLFGNRIFAWLADFIPSIAVLNSTKYIVDFAVQQIQHHDTTETPNNNNHPKLADLLSRFRKTRNEMTKTEFLNATLTNIFAGSDTTAASLSAIFYHLSRSPKAHATLLAEIDAADRAGHLSDPITFAEAQSLKYLQATIKEGLRMHPAVGLLLERVVPAGGAQVGDHFLPAGTIVGMNPWVAARDKTTYGADADSFRPERWLEADEARLRMMERNFLAFGAGTRTCLGRHISLLEMSKLLPQVLRRFDFELCKPEREWRVRNYWFVMPSQFMCRVKRREK